MFEKSYKKCPKCSGIVFKTATICFHCGHKFITNELSWDMLEKQAVSLFEMAGWHAVIPTHRSKSRCYDIVLSLNKKEVGFVEIFKGLSERALIKKIKTFRDCVVEEKPQIAVLTNLYTFLVSYNGKPFIEIKHTPTPFEGEFFVDTVKEYVEEIAQIAGEKNDDDK